MSGSISMNDTSPEIQEIYRNMLMQKTEEERFLMGLSMCETARRIVLSTFPEGLSEAEKRVKLLYRYYSNDFSPEELKKISAFLTSDS